MAKRVLVCDECASDLNSEHKVSLKGAIRRFCSTECLEKHTSRKPNTNWWEDAYMESFRERTSVAPIIPTIRPVSSKLRQLLK